MSVIHPPSSAVEKILSWTSLVINQILCLDLYNAYMNLIWCCAKHEFLNAFQLSLKILHKNIRFTYPFYRSKHSFWYVISGVFEQFFFSIPLGAWKTIRKTKQESYAGFYKKKYLDFIRDLNGIDFRGIQIQNHFWCKNWFLFIRKPLIFTSFWREGGWVMLHGLLVSGQKYLKITEIIKKNCSQRNYLLKIHSWQEFVFIWKIKVWIITEKVKVI